MDRNLVRFASLPLLVLALAAPAWAGEAAAASGAPAPAARPLHDIDAPRVREVVSSSGAKAVLVNVWATWCLPCREEMPDLVRLHREYKGRGFELVLVSADFADQRQEAANFLAEQGVDFDSYLKRQKDQEFIDGIDPRWGGALPASFLYDAKGKIVAFWEGKVTFEELQGKLLELL